MNVKLLIDGIVRQTTVLIAQLSTAAGSRAPLSHVTDEVFLSLAREIEAQGVRRQVVADMFGMALRSYQKKMQRLTEGATQRDRTLWEAVLDFVATEQPTKGRVLERFSRDGEKEVMSVLSDLVRSGLVFTTGSGRGAIYGATQDDLRQAVLRDHDQESLENWLWLKAFRLEVTTVPEAHAALPSVEASLVDAALEELIASGRLLREGEQLSSSNLVIPMGTEQGWETAVLDHFRTVAVAIAKKVSGGFAPSSVSDETGGSTFTYTVSPGHPFEQQVRSLLARTRRDAQALWDEVAAFNQQHPPDLNTASRISFYAGQLVESLVDEEPAPDSTASNEDSTATL